MRLVHDLDAGIADQHVEAAPGLLDPRKEGIDRVLEFATLPKSETARKLMDRLDSNSVRNRVWVPSHSVHSTRAYHRLSEDGLPMPTLVFWGQNDPSAPIAIGHRLYQRLAAHTPHAEMHILNHAGHSSFADQPRAFNRALTSFCLS